VILADTSVWVQHLRVRDSSLDRLLQADGVAMHPFVLGEIALGYLNPRHDVLNFLRRLPAAEVAENKEVVEFIDRYQLFGTGLGYVDVHLLTGAALSFCAVWTRDKRLCAVAEKLGIAARGLN
jgi:hypothetical protein